MRYRFCQKTLVFRQFPLNTLRIFTQGYPSKVKGVLWCVIFNMHIALKNKNLDLQEKVLQFTLRGVILSSYLHLNTDQRICSMRESVGFVEFTLSIYHQIKKFFQKSHVCVGPEGKIVVAYGCRKITANVAGRGKSEGS